MATFNDDKESSPKKDRGEGSVSSQVASACLWLMSSTKKVQCLTSAPHLTVGSKLIKKRPRMPNLLSWEHIKYDSKVFPFWSSIKFHVQRFVDFHSFITLVVLVSFPRKIEMPSTKPAHVFPLAAVTSQDPPKKTIQHHHGKPYNHSTPYNVGSRVCNFRGIRCGKHEVVFARRSSLLGSISWWHHA